MRIAALGRTRALIDTVRRLAAAGHDIVLIATNRAEAEYGIDERSFEALANEFSCEYICDSRIGSPAHLAAIDRARPDIGVSINWKTLVPPSVLAGLPMGIINAHGGDLPNHRGNAIPNWIILQGEHKFVICLHFMVAELDAGPVVLKRAFPLGEDTYVGDLYEIVYQHVPEMFLAAIDLLAANPSFRGAPQPDDPALASRCFSRRPEDSLIDWREPADSICRLVRASSRPFLGAFTYYDRARLTVWRAHKEIMPFMMIGIPGQVVEVRKSGEVAILTGSQLLVLEEVRLQQNAGPVRPAEILNSTRARLGLAAGELPVAVVQGASTRPGKEPG